MSNKQLALVMTLCLLFLVGAARAQDVVNEFQGRTSFEASYSPIKKLKLTVSPELRFDESFALSKYHIEGEAAYKLNKQFTVGASYRFVVNPRDSKDTEYFSRFGFGLTYQKKLDRFEPSFRVLYSNYADDDTENSKYLRFKAGLEYNIPKCKITPQVGIEAFRDQIEGEVFKMRYTAGADYKLFKKNYIGIKYKLDYYRTAYYNRHIVGLSYKIKF